MLNILINAYAISPHWGSELGMGWNWIINIAKYCNCFVITEGEYHNEIEKALLLLPQKDNIHLHYIPVQPVVRRMFYNQGDWRFYHYYAKWEKKALEKAREICRENRIDIIHKLNLVGFREPGELWKIPGIPYVWGPISGYSETNSEFFKDAGIATRIKIHLKNHINKFQLRHSRKIRKAIEHADAIITIQSQKNNPIESLFGKKCHIIPETGITGRCVSIEEIHRQYDSKTLEILWVGRFINTKKLDIALHTISRLKNRNHVRLHIVGYGYDNKEAVYRTMAKELGIESNCIWHGKTDNAKVHTLMRKCDIFFFTSIYEATSTVVLEAIQNRIPIVCHDTCGFGEIVNDSIGCKIALRSPSESVDEFAKIIDRLYEDRMALKSMLPNFDHISKELTYDYKAELLHRIYKDIKNKV